MSQLSPSLFTPPLTRCSVAPASVSVSTLSPSLTERQPLRAGEIVGQRLDGDQRPAPRLLRQRQHAVEIELRRGQHADQLWLLAEGQLGVTAQLERTVVRPVLELDLLEHRRGAVAFDAAGDAPRLDDQRLPALGSATDRPREGDAAFEARCAAVDPDRDVGVGGDRSLDRIDIEAQPTPPSSATRLIASR